MNKKELKVKIFLFINIIKPNDLMNIKIKN